MSSKPKRIDVQHDIIPPFSFEKIESAGVTQSFEAALGDGQIRDGRALGETGPRGAVGMGTCAKGVVEIAQETLLVAVTI